MQRTLSSSLPAPLLALLLFTPGPVLAHQEHCHVKGADGVTVHGGSLSSRDA